MNIFLKTSFHALLLCFFVASTALFAPEGNEGPPIDDPTNQSPFHEPTREETWMMHEKEHQAPSEPVDPEKPLNWDEDDGLTDSGNEPETPTVTDVHLSLTETPNEKLQNNIESFQNATDGQRKINAALRSLGLEVSYTPEVLPTLDEIDNAYDAQIKKLNEKNPRFTKSTTEGIQIKQGLDAIKKYLDNEVNTKTLINSFDIINHEDVPAPELTIQTMETGLKTFQSAPDNASKITAALQALGLPTDATELPTLEDVEMADLDITTKFSNDPLFTSEIKKQLSEIRTYLEEHIINDTSHDGFTDNDTAPTFHDDFTDNDTAPTLNPKITTLDPSFTEKLSVQDIADINSNYEALTTQEQKEAFLDNLNSLSRHQEFNTAFNAEDIIQESYKDALKATKPKEQSFASKLWNKAERFWTKTFKSEKAYVKTIITQALNGDQVSVDLIKSTEIKEYFKPLDLAQKKEVLQSLQEEATKIGKKLLSDALPKPIDTTDNVAAGILAGKKLDQIIPKFTKSVDALVDSFKPMCDDGQKIFSVWDRDNHNPIINLVDFSKFIYDSSQSISDQVKSLIQDQSLNVPKFINSDPTLAHTSSQAIFEKELTTEIQSIADFQNSNWDIQSMNAQDINTNLYKFSKEQTQKLTPMQMAEISPENMLALNNRKIDIVITKLLNINNRPFAKLLFEKFSPTQLQELYTKLSTLRKGEINSII